MKIKKNLFLYTVYLHKGKGRGDDWTMRKKPFSNTYSEGLGWTCITYLDGHAFFLHDNATALHMIIIIWEKK